MTPREKAKRLAELQAELAAIQAAIAALKNLQVHTHCKDCVFADKQTWYCSEFGDVVPEDYRYQTDCQKFEDDIPF